MFALITIMRFYRKYLEQLIVQDLSYSNNKNIEK